MIAVQGPNARAKVWQALPGSEAATRALKPFFGARSETAPARLFIARTGYTGEDGFEIMVPADARGGDCGTRSRPRASRRAASARATRCGSRPA